MDEIQIDFDKLKEEKEYNIEMDKILKELKLKEQKIEKMMFECGRSTATNMNKVIWLTGYLAGFKLAIEMLEGQNEK